MWRRVKTLALPFYTDKKACILTQLQESITKIKLFHSSWKISIACKITISYQRSSDKNLPSNERLRNDSGSSFCQSLSLGKYSKSFLSSSVIGVSTSSKEKLSKKCQNIFIIFLVCKAEFYYF